MEGAAGGELVAADRAPVLVRGHRDRAAGAFAGREIRMGIDLHRGDFSAPGAGDASARRREGVFAAKGAGRFSGNRIGRKERKGGAGQAEAERGFSIGLTGRGGAIKNEELRMKN